ncbi:MAG TPA: BON domain-containing protein [Longimicrobiales bacterium]|nr:BON domain-containing protein [Longimicrobiales bacterium]
MAKGYDDVYDVDAMDDGELRDLIVQLLGDEPAVDVAGVDVAVRDGLVRVSGRLGTEDEADAVERILVERLGVDRLENDLVIDELVRPTLSEGADDASVQAERGRYERITRGDRTDPEAEHLMEDVEGDLYGTEDLQKAIDQGESYTPPDAPHEEGTRSRERH